MCLLLSIRRCAEPASDNSKTLSITGLSLPAPNNGQIFQTSLRLFEFLKGRIEALGLPVNFRRLVIICANLTQLLHHAKRQFVLIYHHQPRR